MPPSPPMSRRGSTAGDLYYFRRMREAGAVDCLQADVSRCGGITEWLRSWRSASYGLEIFGHCLFLTVRRQ